MDNLSFATLCHDLRQPLYAARLSLAALQARAALAQPEREALRRVEAALAAVELMVAHAGHPPRRVPVALGQLIEQLVAELAPAAQSKGVLLKGLATKRIAHSDPVLLERLLRNLVTNAIAYSSKGSVVVGCRRQGRHHIRIEVWDQGPGIDGQQLAECFRPYRRLGRSESGEGLGLTSVRLLADSLGHDIQASSCPGRGSCFAVIIDQGTKDGND
ncbi:sensor histidine kinase [Novispirillum sp. DQ9]|uniref:sensor histidine kinase n=1 Tax=Novispirillum sp. DQ9 TaxID=3398612 RepID=UPI003C7B0D1A